MSHSDEKLANQPAGCPLNRQCFLDLTLGNKVQVFEDLAQLFMRLRTALHLANAPGKIPRVCNRGGDIVHCT